VKSVRPFDIQSGFIDSDVQSGSYPSEAFTAFPIEADTQRTRPEDLFEQPGYRFWFVFRDGVPVLAMEQSAGRVWTTHGAMSENLTALYQASGRNMAMVAARLLAEAEPA